MADPTLDVRPTPMVTAPASPAGDDDPFLRLHKMSITAGLGSGDYVAISGLAVAAVLLGVASAVVLFHNHFLLLVPLAAAACAVAAWVQIGRSNGTLTGRGLALLGLGLAVLLGGYEGGRTAYADLTVRSDRQHLVGMINEFGRDIVADQYAKAYQLCNDSFRASVPLDAFEGRWRSIHHSTVLGNMTGMDWNGLLSFETDPVSGRPTAGGMVLISFDKAGEPSRTDMFFREDDAGWGIDRMPQLFPPPAPVMPNGTKGVYGPPKPV